MNSKPQSPQKIKKKAVKEILSSGIKSPAGLYAAKRKAAKKYDIPVISNSEILSLARREAVDPELKAILRKRAVRTLSGIAPVAVLTKPYPCPGNCAYCPAEKNVPQSYLSNEPAVMRALRCGYDPYIQIQDRLRALINNGHEPTKIELIVIGGTWSYLPKKYKYWFIANLFAGANNFKISDNQHSIFKKKAKINNKYPISLDAKALNNKLNLEQKKNERARYKIVGLTLETRPDFISHEELREMRELGCTRVEIGVQAVDDKILNLNKRGHGVKETAAATRLLKDFGFKVTYHIMPGLPGSTPKKDLSMFKSLFSDERFRPDQIKFYPTVVTKGSLLYRWWRQGKYRPYPEKALKDLIIKCKRIIPEYVRVIRLIRDIPGESIIAGNKTTNLRQVMQSQGVECRCIRCREIKGRRPGNKGHKLEIAPYKASAGQEIFIQAVSLGKENFLLGFCRLRLPLSAKNPRPVDPMGDSAMIRELHVYGELVSIGSKKKNQHSGLGKELLKKAEEISRKNKIKKIKIISGVGVRGYYRKNGYRLRGAYMAKNL